MNIYEIASKTGVVDSGDNTVIINGVPRHVREGGVVLSDDEAAIFSVKLVSLSNASMITLGGGGADQVNDKSIVDRNNLPLDIAVEELLCFSEFYGIGAMKTAGAAVSTDDDLMSVMAKFNLGGPQFTGRHAVVLKVQDVLDTNDSENQLIISVASADKVFQPVAGDWTLPAKGKNGVSMGGTKYAKYTLTVADSNAATYFESDLGLVQAVS